jgi:hypothetical protein
MSIIVPPVSPIIKPAVFGGLSDAGGGPPPYNPEMTNFDGTEYFSHTADETGAGNKITLTARFRGDYLDLGAGGKNAYSV